MRQAFLRSKQPLSREELDNRLTRNRHEQYWHDVSTAFSNAENVVDIYVDNETVGSFLQQELNVSYRRSVSAGECQKQYEGLRAMYEASRTLGSYRRSGQGSPHFFPHFCTDNAVHVYLHYIMCEDKEKSGNEDLSTAAFSLIDSRKHVNSMHMPGVSTSTSYDDVDEDVPSSDNQPPKKATRKSIFKRLSRTLDKVIEEVNRPAKRRRTPMSIVDILEKKVRVKKLWKQLKELNEEDPDEDYERDNNLLGKELSTINNELTKADQHSRNDHHIELSGDDSAQR